MELRAQTLIDRAETAETSPAGRSKPCGPKDLVDVDGVTASAVLAKCDDRAVEGTKMFACAIGDRSRRLGDHRVLRADPSDAGKGAGLWVRIDFSDLLTDRPPAPPTCYKYCPVVTTFSTSRGFSLDSPVMSLT